MINIYWIPPMTAKNSHKIVCKKSASSAQANVVHILRNATTVVLALFTAG